MFISLVVLSQVKQPCLQPAISFCLANVTKRDFLAGMHLLPDQLPRTEACQKTTHWLRCSFVLPWNYALPQPASQGLGALCMILAAFIHSLWGKGCTCLPFYFSVLIPIRITYMLCLPRPPSVVGQVIPQEEIQKQNNLLQALFTGCARKRKQICLYWGHSFKLYQWNHVPLNFLIICSRA